MSPQSAYEFVIFLLGLTIVLELAARRLNLPPAAALIVGGIVLALIPGVPTIEIAPEVILTIFLPPLLMHSAYFTVWRDFKRYFVGIASLALGAVAFTTFSVGVVFHLLFPQFPWAVGFALGAIVAPPDAVSAAAVLERLHLPSRITALLEGESLVNDASGLVLFRFAVAAALTGSFSLSEAIGSFAWETIGGVLVGLLAGWLGLFVIRRLRESELIITATLILTALSYIAAERLHSSGVLSTVTTGLLLGWHQHEAFSAATRIRTHAFWRALAFLLESLLFILIGLSLRGVLDRIGGLREGIAELALPIAGIVVVVIVARFVWLLGSGVVRRFVPLSRLSGEASSLATATVISWAGMRGVVTLAGALSLPMQMPGRDIVLVAAFAVIVVTVLLQGTTLGALVSLLKIGNLDEQQTIAENEANAWRRVAQAQYQAVQRLSRNTDGTQAHPRLLEQYKHRAEVASHYEADRVTHDVIKSAHFEAVLQAIHAGRAEILKMRGTGEIHDSVMRRLERELDLQELAAENRQ
ncbi:Na+/H+ antiporter [Neorhizobium lilium]|uniref:Na+/H+ antiporter n=1 Tax=Neorhizobium lilium TaxID=2503024 RepID=A0A444LLB9_9HYPH|nr:Na+/H+ antiporter [Neorhizobium lilium]RWX81146.1 Na+/H+ antiporter [Neorhizobium lilium]